MMLLQNKEKRGLSGILSAPDSKNKDDFSASLPTLFADPTTNAARQSSTNSIEAAGPKATISLKAKRTKEYYHFPRNFFSKTPSKSISSPR